MSREKLDKNNVIQMNIPEKNKKILITYVYFETIESLKNLKFFICNGVYDDDNVQYNFIIKDKKCSAVFPKFNNIKVCKVVNEGYDFGGYSSSINFIDKTKFNYFIFLNDTVIGPFVPRYISKKDWYNRFIYLLSDKVKLVGCTINRKEYNSTPKHVQSMSFAVDIVGLNLLIKENIFNLENNIKVYKNEGKGIFIKKFEVNTSKIIMDNGYDISSFMQVDNFTKEKIEHEDVVYPDKYFGTTLNPIEIMFIKTNRINNLVLENYIKWNEC